MATAQQINSFKEITGEQSDEMAKNVLAACDGNLEQAIELHFMQAANESAVNGEMQVDNDDDVEIIEDESVSMRNDVDEEGVRRPIRPVQERLVEQSFNQYYGLCSFMSIYRTLLGGSSRRQRAHPVFEQFRDITAGSSSGLYTYPGDDVRFDPTQNRAVRSTRQTRHQKNLAEIFRPPIDIIERLDWDSLLQKAREQGRWILVNLQDSSEFACQVLNRDVWSNNPLKDMIKQNLLFWQVYSDSPEGRRISSYYQQEKYPAIFILDPRTGELISEIRSRDVNDMITELFDFCSQYPSFEARDHEYIGGGGPSIPPSVETATQPGPSTTTTSIVMTNGKRKEPLDKNSPDYQAKRMKKNDDIEADKVQKTQLKLGPWESYVVPASSDTKEINLVLRLPSNERRNLRLNGKCPLKTVFAFISTCGIEPTDCVLVLLYPKREYNLSHGHLTFDDLNFSSQELIHVDKTI
ncbi:UBX domain-containing protein 7 [Aphelenchoides besseyi]|nr:UBX domain-containing protein 7 [Aphelenchoides besseyi]